MPEEIRPRFCRWGAFALCAWLSAAGAAAAESDAELDFLDDLVSEEPAEESGPAEPEESASSDAPSGETGPASTTGASSPTEAASGEEPTTPRRGSAPPVGSSGDEGVAQDTAPQPAATLPPRSGGVIEEVVVTARRREENLQEIPIAVSALTGEELRERGLTNIQDLTKSIPSLQITSGQSNQIYIRGVGQRTGFVRTESAVGVYLDDLYLPRAEGQLLETVDVESLQVLRGPQGTLFGKNTTGGALVLTLAKPHDTVESYVEATVGNYTTIGARAMINAPVTDDFFVRLTANTIRDDGYTKDIRERRRNDSIDRQAVIAQTRWEPIPELTLDALGYYGRIRERFSATNCLIANEDALFLNGLFVAWPGDTDPSNLTAYRENCESNSRERLPDLRTNNGDTNLNFDDELDTLMFGTTARYALTDQLDVKAIFGIQDANRGPIMSSDNDGGPANFNETHSNRPTDRLAMSLEVQLNGTALDGRLSFTSGLFGMRERNDDLFLLATSLIGLDATTAAQLGGGQEPSPPPPGGTTPVVGILTGPILDQRFVLDNLTLAPFFQASYDLTEALQLTAGLRYTAEHRDTELELFETDKAAVAQRLLETGRFSPAFPGPSGTQFQSFQGSWLEDPVGLAASLFPDENRDGIPDYPILPQPTREQRSKTFSSFTPMASLSWFLPERWLEPLSLEGVMTYFTWSNGFKAGYFEPRLTDGLVLVEQETVQNLELGFKIDALDRRLRVNAAVYSLDFDDLQLINVSTDSQGNLAVVFDNVARARIDGGELEATWIPDPKWLVNLSYSRNSYNYLEFTDRDLLQQALGNEVDVDRTDEPFPVSPEETLAAGLQYRHDTAVGIFVPRIDLSYKSEIFLGLDHGSALAFERNRELAGAGPSVLLDLRLGWMNLDGDLSVAGFVRNLTDHRTLSGTAAVADSVGTFNQSYGEPRRYGLEFRKTF